MLDKGRYLYEEVVRHIADLTLLFEQHLGDEAENIYRFHPLFCQVLLDNALEAAAELNPVNLACLRPWGSPAPSPEFVYRLRKLLADEKSWLLKNLDEWSVYGPAVVRVLIRPSSPLGKQLSSHTHEQVVAAMVRALRAKDKQPTSLFDPTCGFGTLLATAAGNLRDQSLIIAGLDFDPEVLPFAQRVLAISGRVPNLSTLQTADLPTMNSFPLDSLPDKKFDLVVINPPHGKLEVSRTQRLSGTASQLPTLDWRMLELAWEKVTPVDSGGGTLIAFLETPALNSSDHAVEALSRWIHDQDLVKALIAMPQNKREFRGKTALVLSTAMSKGFVGKTQVVDLRSSFNATRRRRRIGAQRHISVEGVSVLDQTLNIPKPPSRQVRTVQRKEFERTRFHYRVPGVSAVWNGRRYEAVSFSRDLSSDESQWEWPFDHADIRKEFELRRDTPRIDWRVDWFMGNATSKKARKLLKLTDWPLAPLLTLAQHVEYDGRTMIDTIRDAESYWTDTEKVLTLPTEDFSDITFGELGDDRPNSRSILVKLSDGIDGFFLARWLKTELGAICIDVARRQFSHRQNSDPQGRFPVEFGEAFSFLAHLVVPIPSIEEASNLLKVQDLIHSKRRSLGDVEDELWKNPHLQESIASTVRSFGESDDLSAWAETLPYPMASSFRTFQALQHDSAQQSAQLVHFWEASATFLATYLMSALRSSDELWRREVPLLHETLKKSELSFEKSSIGTWRVTIERLAKLFRNELQDDDVEIRQRAEELLGFPPRSVRDRILDPNLVQCLSRLNKARNDYGGHPPTMNEAQADEKLRDFKQLTEDLKAAVGFGWSDFPLVRPVPGRTGFSGGRYSVTADKMVGPTIPFISQVYDREEALEDGSLYLLGVGGAVKLMPFVKFGQALHDRETTALFYNRRTSDGVRMVAYQYAIENELTETNGEISSILDDLATAKTPTDLE